MGYVILPRSLIGVPEPPADRPKPGRVKWLLGHYTGVDTTKRYRSADPDDVLADARAVATFGIAAGKRWEYSYLIGLDGSIFTQAGEYRAAHCLNANDWSKAFLFMVAVSVQPSEAMLDAARWLRAHLVSIGELDAQHDFAPHYRLRLTSCCGDTLAEPFGARWDSPTGQGFLGDLHPDLTAPWTPPAPPPAPEPIEEDEMTTARMWRHPKYSNVFLVGAGPAINLSWELYESYTNAGVPLIVEEHPQMLKSCLAQAGLTEADLEPA